MPVQKISIDQFATMPRNNFLLLDVRSPAEYTHANIPGAFNLPLFSNEERVVVGTSYKQQSRENAIKVGLTYFGPKMLAMVEEVERLIAADKYLKTISDHKSVPIVVHCWRGGMRSAAVAWLLDLYGFKVHTIIGGYKAYRNIVINQFELSYNFKVIGGFTGSGKTDILNRLSQQGETVIDFEDLAKHKGSAFGAVAGVLQPSTEMFENLLAEELMKHKDKTIWVEDESQRIGDVNMPIKLYNTKQQSPIYFLEIPFEERLDYIVKGYGKIPKDKLVNSIIRIKKRLGGLETKTAINCLLEEDIKGCFAILLKYYDKHYQKGLYSRDNIKTLLKTIPCNKVDAIENAIAILNS
ncbi:MAG: tRNA 2-selenouridine(34) synthase MnmH [Bacteroidota bacterium]